MAPYSVRVVAAKTFARLSGKPEAAFKSGSGELDLLSSKQAADPIAAEKPFYYEARLKAADGASSPDVRIRLLRGALEYFPSSDAARVPLFRSALKQSKFQVAVSAMEPLLQIVALTVVSSDIGSTIEPTARDSEIAASVGLSRSERTQVLAGLALAFERLERYDEAITTYQQAIRLEKLTAIKAELRKSLNAVRTIVSRRKLNLARQPMVRPELEQANVVRPRLQVPQSVSPPRTVPAKAKPPASAQGARRTQ